MKVIAEYIWLDGKNLVKDEASNFRLDQNKNPDIRSKTKILNHDFGSFKPHLTVQERQGYVNVLNKKVHTWGFDGSSTGQAEGHFSDCVLRPVRVYLDPLRTIQRPDYLSILVLNEVFDVPGDRPHASNTRALLRSPAEKYKEQEFLFGIEQEYTFMRVDENDFSSIAGPLGFPKKGGNLPEPQGKYYCGNGADKIIGRELVDEHMYACLDANLVIHGTNAEVMPGQWEFQMGNGTSESSPLRVADDLLIARYLLSRIGEKYGAVASLFSRRQKEHIVVYGEGIEERLTGKHETCPYTEFRAGVSDRGASIRIPWQVDLEKKGYMEDRRPCANMDPHVVMAKIMDAYNS